MDARKAKSRAAIVAAFSELLREEDYGKITVGDIIARAHVGRATFYGLFKSKDGLLAELVRDLGGHDLKELQATFKKIDNTRPTAIFAYTIKGRGLSIEGHPSNHAAQLTLEQMQELATASGMSLDDPWQRFADGTDAARVCSETAARLSLDPPMDPRLVASA